MVIHELKTWCHFFDAIERGDKTFEIRKNDRGFQKGDVLRLRKYDPRAEVPNHCRYIGRQTYRVITYVLTGFGLRDDYVALGLRELNDEEHRLIEYADV